MSVCALWGGRARGLPHAVLKRSAGHNLVMHATCQPYARQAREELMQYLFFYL